MLKCKDCEKYWKMSNVINGICSLPESFFPTNAEDDCHYLTCDKLTCKDCSHFMNDTACLIAEEDDDICCGFQDKAEDDIYTIFFNWFKRGEYSREKVLALCNQFESSNEYMFFNKDKEK